jgi:UDP-N-acetylglucosamine acyltransferase
LIDPRAVVSPDARLHENVELGPYAVVGPNVEIGSGSRIESHVVIKGPTTIGEDNHIFQFASIGDDPQDKKYAGEPTELIIGDGNTIREYCTVNRGTTQDQGVTRIGNENWIMAYTHIAHDCVVGNQTIFANNASIAGHVQVEDYVVLGGFTAVHQFCRIGTSALTSMFSYVTKDVPAFIIVAGRPVAPRSVNIEGLKRRGYSDAELRSIRSAYRTVYRQGLSLGAAIEELEARVGAEPAIEPFLNSLQTGSRGLAR